MIYGKRVRFRSIERDDIPKFVKWLNDPDVRDGISRILPISIAEENDWFTGVLSRSEVERPFVIEIQEGTAWETIGNCGFFNVDWRIRSAELGIMIGEKRYWNRGYGTNAMNLLLKIGFETLNLNRIMLRVHDNNPRAIHVYEKVGFVMEGTLRQAEYRNGKYLNMYVMSVLYSEWKRMEGQND